MKYFFVFFSLYIGEPPCHFFINSKIIMYNSEIVSRNICIYLI